jgi:hypothetical protein
MRSTIRRILSVLVLSCTIHGGPAYPVLVTIPFDTAGSAAAQTAPFGISLFVSNSFANTVGISGAFTGNVAAPIGPPGALQLGSSPGPLTYFHFSPLPGYEIDSIGISATGGFTGLSTTFRVFAANENAASIQFDTVMTPTGAGIAGLNGGAVFLSANSLPLPSPITAFRVWQLDDGFGILDNLVVDVTAVPEGRAFMAVALAGFLCSVTVAARRWKSQSALAKNSC